MRALLLPALLAAACGSPAPRSTTAPPASPAAASSTAPGQPAADAAPPLDDCAEACTEIAVCWEEQNPGREYSQGGSCTSACESGTPEEKKTFFECVQQSGDDCAKMTGCG